MIKFQEKFQKLYLAIRNRLRERVKETPRIFFCHVPKCAGSAASKAIYRNIYMGTANSSDFVINLQASRFSSQVCKKDMMEVREVILSYYLCLPYYRFGGGHCYCRPHLVQKHKDKWKFVTLLRDPVSRWISEYVYNTYKNASWNKNELTLEEYMTSEEGKNTGISYLRYFSSIPKNYNGDVDQFVNEAIANLEQFSVIGVVENLDQWCQMFKDTFMIDLNIPKTNATPNKEVAAKIRSNENLVKQIKELCEPDIRIYQHFAAKH